MSKHSDPPTYTTERSEIKTQRSSHTKAEMSEVKTIWSSRTHTAKRLRSKHSDPITCTPKRSGIKTQQGSACYFYCVFVSAHMKLNGHMSCQSGKAVPWQDRKSGLESSKLHLIDKLKKQEGDGSICSLSLGCSHTNLPGHLFSYLKWMCGNQHRENFSDCGLYVPISKPPNHVEWKSDNDFMCEDALCGHTVWSDCYAEV